MSIWSSFGGVEGLYEVAYGKLGEPNPKTYLDLAMAHSWYGDSAIRVSLDDDDGHACAVLSRDQVIKLVKDLQQWLDDSKKARYG